MSVSGHLANLVPNATIAVTICLLTLSGCSGSDSTTRPATASRAVQRDHLLDWELPVVSGTELLVVVQQSDRPVLVEFGVNFGCVRCDDMRPHHAAWTGRAGHENRPANGVHCPQIVYRQ